MAPLSRPRAWVMQIVEVTDFGVRSPAIRRRRPGTALQFVLYPMIHVAEPAFYDTITARLKQADLLVVQGVGRRRTGTAGTGFGGIQEGLAAHPAGLPGRDMAGAAA